jgi:hypothetical protein
MILEFFHVISVALRRIGDTKSRLETIYAKQRQLNASVAVAEQDRRANELMSKVTVCFIYYQKRKSSFLFTI